MTFQIAFFFQLAFDRQADSLSYGDGANEKLVESGFDGFVFGSFGMFVSEAERSDKKGRERSATNACLDAWLAPVREHAF